MKIQSGSLRETEKTNAFFIYLLNRTFGGERSEKQNTALGVHSSLKIPPGVPIMGTIRGVI